MIFTGRSVDALDEVRGSSGVVVQSDERRDVKAVAIAAGWFSSLRRPGKRNKRSCQKQAKSAWDLTTLSTLEIVHNINIVPVSWCTSITVPMAKATSTGYGYGYGYDDVKSMIK
ncbi:cytohesin-1 isoform X3 [Vespula squamosa]|uniref:Cytohesin-1 isoform X3 n=1 Tax=Vespula squamosa TaxID=30214 RepID=A0ABD2A763_VESSQ